MALPKLNSSPKYEMTIPSSGQRVKFRPFLIKEEKNMLIATESGDTRNILIALLDTLKACIDEEINENKLATFDIEYMFLQLRAKSVGETARIGIECEHCKTPNELEVNIDDLKITMPEINKVVNITDDIQVELDYPSFNNLMTAGVDTDSFSNTEQLFKMMNYCFKTLTTPEERINLREVSQEEVTEFIESMDSKQLLKIREFLESIPRLKKDYEITCKSCGHVNKSTLEGLANFLS